MLAALYPSQLLGSDPSILRDFAQAAEGAGYGRLVFAEHVLGADPDRPGGWTGPYTHETEWQEPFVTFGYLAAVTQRIELMTGVLVLPQRQTALVAKQVAQLEVLSGGRIVLGVGTGWNTVEFDALGQDFRTRGRRMDEQIRLLRLLWREPVVTFQGEFDRVDRAGINPLPPRRNVPIWMGGSEARALDRIGRLGDGWFPIRLPRAAVAEGREHIRATAERAGRDAGAIGLQCVIAASGELDAQVAAAKRFEASGATHIGYATQDSGFTSLQQHIDALRRFAEAM